MSRSKPSIRELRLSDDEKRKVVKAYGLDLEDYDDLMKMGPRPSVEKYSGLVGTVPYDSDTLMSASWDRRLKELQTRAQTRREAKAQRQVDDWEATVRGKETPTQKEVRQKSEKPADVPVTQSKDDRAPSGDKPIPRSSASAPVKPGPTPSSGQVRVTPLQRRGMTGGISVGPDKQTTLNVSGMGFRPTADNISTVTEGLRRQLLDAPSGVDITTPLYTNSEVRLLRRNEAQKQMYRDWQSRLTKLEADAAARADERAWGNGSLRGERDWNHYGEVANTGGDGWKKGGTEYNAAIGSLREKMAALTKLADQGLLHENERVMKTDVNGRRYMADRGNPRKRADGLYGMINKTDSGAGLTQKQFDVANAHLDSLLETANRRKDMREAGQAFRVNRLREELNLPEGTPAAAVLKADGDRREANVKNALVSLSNPGTWNSPEYWNHLETIQKNGVGLASAFTAAMKDPEMRRSYGDALKSLQSGEHSDAEIANLQNRYAVVGLQRQRKLNELNLRPLPVVQEESTQGSSAPAGQLTDEQKAALGIQAAQDAGASSDTLNTLARPIGPGTADQAAGVRSPLTPRSSERSSSQGGYQRRPLGGLGAPGSVWMQPLQPRGRGVL